MSSQFESLKTSLEQAIEMAKGDKSIGLVRTVTRKKIEVEPLQDFSSEDIKSLRVEHGLTQKSFALCMGVTPQTVEGWERGSNKPSGSATRLLQMYDSDPDIFITHGIAKEA